MATRRCSMWASLLGCLLVAGCTRVISPRTDASLPTVTPAEVKASTAAVRSEPVVLTDLAPSPTPGLVAAEEPTSSPTPTETSTSTPTRVPTRPPTSTPLPTGPIGRVDTKFRSAALGLERRVVIYLPPGYNQSPQRRYPVIYLLHGYGGFVDPAPEWEKWGLKDAAETMMLKGQIQPVIIVQPYGFMEDGQPSYFFNHGPGTDGKRWGDYIWQDVVSYTDASFRTLQQPQSRAIGGFSLGGQGALSLALNHPDVFKIVGAHSPSFRGADGSIPFINDWNYFNQYDPIWLVQNKDTASRLAIWLDVGMDDDKVRKCGPGSDRCVEAFHELLAARSIPHEWHGSWPGPHEGAYWAAHIPEYLAWYSSQLVTP